MYREIQVAIPSYQKKSVFDYYTEDVDCRIGSVVKISFRKQEVIGVVVGDKKSGIDKSKLKPILEIFKSKSFSEQEINFFKFAASYNMASLGGVLKLVMPSLSEFSLLEEDLQDAPIYKVKKLDLSLEQQKASEFILSILKKKKHDVIVLEGVTGSGKTEVYSTAIAKILEQESGQVLVLLPEIMLATQFASRFEDLFGVRPVMWHSEISKKNKKNALRQIFNGSARIVLSARSGLFLPFKDMKLIVVDEEHDLSYKQEDGVIYNARDMAVACGYYLNIPIILSSATPSIETLYNVTIGKYKSVTLESRYSGTNLPKMQIVDMAKAKLARNCWISEELKAKINEYLGKNKQVLLFLNRRGYAPVTLCKSCGHKETCVNCSIFLVAHKKTNKLLCHYCGYSKDIVDECSACHEADSLIHCGPGVERVMDEVKNFWPDISTMIVTKDTVDEDTDQSIISTILDQKVQIIIGTQVLSKGHHFPALDLVGIIDADLGLFGADLRASEKTFQLLTQVSGRAGRESIGEVVVQTYYPDNQILKAISLGKKDEFYQLELESRKQMNMPPFTRLIGLVISGKTESKVHEFVDELATHIKYDTGFTVLGPVAAPVSYLNGRYRYRFLLKSTSGTKLQNFVSQWLSKVEVPSSIRVKIDVDPYSFM